MLNETAPDARPEDLEPVATPHGAAAGADSASLADDVSALIDDGKTYVEAEIAYQKTRASYVGQTARDGVVFGLGALAFLHLALIGLVVGLIIALEPYLTAFGATAAVVIVLLVGMIVLARIAARRFGSIGDAFGGEDP